MVLISFGFIHFCTAGLKPSTFNLKTNLTGSFRRILLVLFQHWKHLLVRWYMNPWSPVNTWMKLTPKRNCFLPHLLVKLSKKWCWRIFPRYKKCGWIPVYGAVCYEYNLKCACCPQIVPYFYKIPMVKKNGQDVSGLETELKEKLTKLNKVG